MTVAFFTPKMIIGGAEQYIISKAKYLVSKGYRVIVVSHGGVNVKSLPDTVKHFTVELDIAPYSISVKKCEQLVDKLIQLIRSEQIDIIEAHNTYPVYYAYLCNKLMGVPFVYNLLNELSHKTKLNIVNLLIKELDNKGLYFNLTNYMNICVEQLLNKKLFPVILPIPVEKLPNIPIINDNFILTVCRFSCDKMYVLALINGFSSAYSEGKLPQNIKLKIVGDGELRPMVEQVVCEANRLCGSQRVELLGTKTSDDLYKLYASCSLYAGCGTTILQAAQYKKAIIKVACLENIRDWAWGFWGDRPNDFEKIVAFNEQAVDKIKYADILIECFKNEELLVSKGEQAALIIESYYNYNKIMRLWEDNYLRVITDKKKIGELTNIKLNFYAYVLRLIYQLCKFVKK